MKSYSEALEIIKTNFKNCFDKTKLETEIIPIENSIGRILAEDIYSDIDLPSFNYSAMDGIVISFNNKISSWDLVGEIKAADSETEFFDETKTKLIMTGGLVPDFCDMVIPIEDLIFEEKKVFLKEKISLKKNQNIRFKAEDLKKNELVFKIGFHISATSISEIASLGKENLLVFKKFTVSVFATGDELILPNEFPEIGKVRASNLYSLLSLCNQFGFDLKTKKILKDKKDLITEELKSALENSNIVLTTGGVSVGKYDLLPEVLKDLGCEIHITKSNIKPGKPMLYATYQNKIPIFCFPGNPVSSFLNFYIYFLSSFYSLFEIEFPKLIYAKLSENVSKKDNKKHFIRGNILNQNSENLFNPAKKQSSGDMTSLANSEYLGILDEEIIDPQKGTSILCIKI